MTGSDDSAILEETERTHGRAALRKNVMAAIALAGAVRSTLGPKGLDKLLLDDEGRVQVTNDGVTVLEAAKVNHPTARMMISSSSTQDRVARDGTTSTVLVAAELLQNAWDLVSQGVHPAVIANGYRMAEAEAQSLLASISRELADSSEMLEATRTSLAGKSQVTIQELLAELAVKASEAISHEVGGAMIADPNRVKVLKNKGGQASESHLVNGVVIPKKPANHGMESNRGEGRILVIDGAIEKQKMIMDASIKLTSVDMLESFRQEEANLLREQVDAVIATGADIVAVKEGVDDAARSQLETAGITLYRRVERRDLEMICRSTGAAFIHSALDALADDCGHFTQSRQEIWGDVSHWVLTGSDTSGQTLVIRGSTDEVMDEVERCFADALGVACQLLEEPQLLPGGGATQVALARALRSHASTVPGREQLAIEAFADALEVIPRTLAENAGLDPLGNLLELTAAQTSKQDDWLGLDLLSGGVHNMDEAGIREPLRITRQSVKGATDSATSVLRIDDILWAREDPQVPDEIQKQLDAQEFGGA